MAAKEKERSKIYRDNTDTQQHSAESPSPKLYIGASTASAVFLAELYPRGKSVASNDHHHYSYRSKRQTAISIRPAIVQYKFWSRAMRDWRHGAQIEAESLRLCGNNKGTKPPYKAMIREKCELALFAIPLHKGCSSFGSLEVVMRL